MPKGKLLKKVGTLIIEIGACVGAGFKVIGVITDIKDNGGIPNVENVGEGLLKDFIEE